MEANEKQCPKCAETIKRAATVCRFCGHTFTGLAPGDDAGPGTSATPAKTSSKKVLGIALLAVLAIIVFAIFSGNSDNGGTGSSPGAVSGNSVAASNTNSEKVDLLKLLSQVSGPISLCATSNDAVLSEVKRLQKGKSDQLTVYSAAQAAIAVCNNSASELEQVKAPDSISGDMRAPIEKALSDSCPGSMTLLAAAWQNFVKMIDSNEGVLAQQYQIKQDADEANLERLQCLAPLIGQSTKSGATEKEIEEASSGL